MNRKIEVTKNGLSIVFSERKGIIIATANQPEFAEEIVRKWNAYEDEKDKLFKNIDLENIFDKDIS